MPKYVKHNLQVYNFSNLKDMYRMYVKSIE